MSEDLKCLYELFPAWSKEDINALYIDLGRNLDIVIARISEGHASLWASKSSQSNVNSSKHHQKQTFRRKAPIFTNERSHNNKQPESVPTTTKPLLEIKVIESTKEEQIIPDAECFEVQTITAIEDSTAVISDICSSEPTIEDELVQMPKISSHLESESIDAPIVVLPNMRDVAGYSVDPPLVNLPFGLRSNDNASEFAPSYNHGELSSMLSPSIVLDDLFPDSIRKIRQITRTNGFY